MLAAVLLAACGRAAPGTPPDGAGSGSAETAPPSQTGAQAPAGDTGSGDAPAPLAPLRVAVLADCEGPLADLYEPTVAAFDTALVIHGGASPAGPEPTDGVQGATAGGRQIEVVGYGCSDGTADGTAAEARRLLEEAGAEVLVGPPSADGGLAVARLATEYPGVVFLDGGSEAQETTLSVGAPNLFRFAGDGAQAVAGLADHAVASLGWRRAAIVGEDSVAGVTAAAGFVAEFCGSGGLVTTRLWATPEETEFDPYVAELPLDVDGYFVGLSGTALSAFLDSFSRLTGKVDPRRFVGVAEWLDPATLAGVGPLLEGAAVATPTPTGVTGLRKATRYGRLVHRAYPSVTARPTRYLAAYFNATTALLVALETAGGETGAPLLRALAGVELDTAYGLLRLDRNRSGVMDNYVVELVREPGAEQVSARTVARVPEVEQTFGGTFSPSTPPPDRANPPCRALDPPPWVGRSVTVGG